MLVAKYYLIGIGVLTLIFGLAYLLAPATLTEPAGFGSLSPSATTDVRATYGGFQIGIGVFLVWAAQVEQRYRAALLLVLFSIGSVLASRVVGLAIDGELNAFHQMGLVFESTLTVLTILVLRKV